MADPSLTYFGYTNRCDQPTKIIIPVKRADGLDMVMNTMWFRLFTKEEDGSWTKRGVKSYRRDSIKKYWYPADAKYLRELLWVDVL